MELNHGYEIKFRVYQTYIREIVNCQGKIKEELNESLNVLNNIRERFVKNKSENSEEYQMLLQILDEHEPKITEQELIDFFNLFKNKLTEFKNFMDTLDD